MHTPISDGKSEDRTFQNPIRLVPKGSLVGDVYAFGAFRKDLIRNIGLERTKGFLFRYGWNMGIRDAKVCKEEETYSTLEELIECGPAVHSQKGYVISKTIKLDVKKDLDRLKVHMESIWENSYEAEEHLSQIGDSTCPVCYTLTGYASGYLTEVIGEQVIFKEVSCRAAGGSECIAIGKNQFLWGDEIKEELYYLKETPIVEQLELTFEQLFQERENLTTAHHIQKKLMEKVVKGNTLDSIIKEVYTLTQIPIIVHTVHGQSVTNTGFSSLFLELTPMNLFQHIKQEVDKYSFSQTFQIIQAKLNSYLLLISPIYLQEKVIGYCTFIFENPNDYKQEISNMIIERVSTVCSLCFLNEKTKLDSFEWMKSFFFEEILSGKYTSNDEILTKASLIQLDLTQSYYICLIDYKMNHKAALNGLELRKELTDVISEYCKTKKQEVLISQNANHIHLLITEKNGDRVSKIQFIEDLHQYLNKKYRHMDFYMGVSKKTDSIQEAPSAYKDSLASLRMVAKNKPIVFFDTLGLVGTLINDHNENEVRLMAKSLLGNIQMSNKKNVDLIRTLYSFLLNGGNLEKTAEDLSFSISGLRYRISKIESLLQMDIRNPMSSSQLLFSIQALIILGELNFNISQ